MRKFIVVLCFALLPVCVQAEPEMKGTPDELTRYLSSLPKEVTLSGESTLEVQDESGIVTIGIKTESPQLENSLLSNQQLRNKIITQLGSSGIPQDRIKGTKFSSTPEYGFLGKKPNNYIVENILKITVENENELQKVAGIVDNYKDVYYQGIELKEKNRDGIKSQLLNMALANAKQKQKIYEKELGVILKPINFDENISAEHIQLGQKHMKISKSWDNNDGNNMSLGEHMYHGNVNIKYQVISK